MADDTPPPTPLDYRFSLANERTFLAWVRTAVALIAGGLLAAKALHFDHELWRWVVAAPPVVGGALLALHARARHRTTQRVMESGGPLPADAAGAWVSVGLCVYAALVLAAAALDG